jgi:uroporphyrinogen decarboxylase
MLDVIRTPELAAEVTLQPINAFAFDAAIIFSDILPPLVGMGLQLDFAAGEGPVIANPLRSNYDIDLLATPPAEENMAGTLAAIRIVARELAPRGIPLIGFAGAPFTLASYAIEGGGSKNYARTKALMYGEPAAWKRLMGKLVTVQADYLLKQAKAGAQALQVFDSWAGLTLSRQDYERFVAPHNTALYQKVQAAGVPVINFSNGTRQPRPGCPACSVARTPLSGGRRAKARRRPPRPHLQPGPRHSAHDPGGERAPRGGLRPRTHRAGVTSPFRSEEPRTAR